MSALSQLRNVVSTLRPKAPHGLLIVVGLSFVISLLCVLAFSIYSLLQLQSTISDLSVAAGQTSQQTNTSLWIHYIGIALTLILLGALTYFLVGNLLRATQQANAAKDYAEQIVAVAITGFFTIDRKQVIDNRDSPSLNRILKREDLAGSNFLGVLGSIVPDNVLATASDFVNLMFGDKVNENLVDDLNPLKEIEVHIEDSNGEFEQAYLSFTFCRLYDDKKVSQLLVQVEDISEKIRLGNQLQAFKEQSEEQFDLLAKVLHVETPLLSKFLADTDQSLESINSALQKRVISNDENREKVEEIYRTVHAIKADAGALNLELFVNKAGEFEGMLEELKALPEPNGSDFIALTIKLDAFMRQVGQFKSLIEKIGAPVDKQSVDKNTPIVDLTSSERASVTSKAFDDSTAEALAPGSKTKPELLNEKNFVQYANRLAKEHSKSVAFIMTGEELLPEQYNHEVKTVLNQLIENAVVNGIETPQKRVEAKKSSCGLILANFEQQSDGSISFIFKDDGAGIELTHVREAALDKGIIKENEMQDMSVQDITQLIFHSDYPSVSHVDSNVESDISMSYVAATIKELGGSITADAATGYHCEFRMTLPSVENNAMTTSEVA